MSNLAGLYPPIPTPFDDDEQVAFDKLVGNLNKWLAQPLDGVVMPGSNSEAAHLTREERIEIWRVCAEVLQGSGKRLICGTGVETTAETIELTGIAAELGAAAALILPPYFYKPALTHEVLVTHYRTIADASPIPILLYNVPVFTGVDFALPTLLALAEHPRIVGIKDSSSNVIKMGALLAAHPDFQVFAGTGSALLPFLSIGAVGGIMALANIAAEPLHRLQTAYTQARIEEAKQIQRSLVNLNSAITARFGVPGLKYAMDRVGLYGGRPRRPLLPLGAEGQAEIERLLGEIGIKDEG
jgi:4-hydroxy-2-oxoglutarate aldolase